MKVQTFCPITREVSPFHESSSLYELLENRFNNTSGLILSSKVQEIIINTAIDFWNKLTLSNLPLGYRIFSPPKILPVHINTSSSSDCIFALSDFENPTSSMKDRASALCIFDAVTSGKKFIRVASCGNAAFSLAYLASFFNLEVHVYLPNDGTSSISRKITDIGAHIHYSTKYSLSVQECINDCLSDENSYCRLTGINPLTRLGKSTFFSSVLSGITRPSTIYIPVGDGNFATSLLYTQIPSGVSIILYYPRKSGNLAFELGTDEMNLINSGSSIKPLDVREPQDYSYIRFLLKSNPNISFMPLEECDFDCLYSHQLQPPLNDACNVFSGGLNCSLANMRITPISYICQTGNKW